jgi:hypothetical protein
VTAFWGRPFSMVGDAVRIPSVVCDAVHRASSVQVADDRAIRDLSRSICSTLREGIPVLRATRSRAATMSTSS